MLSPSRTVNLAALDLNLLLVFDAIMQERNLTRAGRRVGLSQSAVSHALGRLRQILKDELFERTQDGMRPTPRAHEIAVPLHEALVTIQGALQERQFDPAAAQDCFSLACADYSISLLMGRLLRRVRHEAPGVELRVRPIHNLNLAAELDAGSIDFAIGEFPDVPPRYEQKPLMNEALCCAVHRDHPLAGRAPTLEDIAAFPSATVAINGDDPNQGDGWITEHGLRRRVVVGKPRFLDAKLAAAGLTRRVALTLPHFFGLPQMLAYSDLIAFIPRRLAEVAAPLYDLILHPLPWVEPDIPISLIWHSRSDGLKSSCWLRTQIAEVAREVVESCDRKPAPAPQSELPLPVARAAD